MDNAQVTQEDREALDTIKYCLRTATELRQSSGDCNQAMQAIFWENKALDTLARHRLERSEPVGVMYERRQTGEGVTAEFFSRRRWVLHSEAYTETPLYTTPPEPVAEIERLREALREIESEKTELNDRSDYARGWKDARFRLRNIARAALGDAS